MSDPSPLLHRAGIEEAFRRLGERLAKRGVVADEEPPARLRLLLEDIFSD